MTQKITQVDAFTNEAFRGNPAAICVMDAFPVKSWMQALAIEMNLSETAYVVSNGDRFDLRWFTPGAEVKLCGHATLAAAHVLWEEGFVPQDARCTFDTLSGELEARQEDGFIVIRFPLESTSERSVPDGLNEALGTSVDTVFENRLGYLVVEVENEDVVKNLQPEFAPLGKMPFHGYAVTARGASDDVDFVSRFFGPGLGINEDPVTGSAHCVLGPYWQSRLGKDTMQAHQLSARGGVLRVHVGGDFVELGGEAITVMRGTLV